MTRTKTSKETSRSEGPLTIHGWQVFAHPLFLDQLETLVEQVEQERAANPEGYKMAAGTKVLAAIFKFAFDVIPQDPTRKEYRQGDTLGAERKHWFRAKFGGQRFRLFFRFDTKAKAIVYAWVNDEKTKRTYGSKRDAYAVFGSMLRDGNPPDDWDALIKACTTPAAKRRLKEARKL